MFNDLFLVYFLLIIQILYNIIRKQLHNTNTKGEITELSRPGFSKTLVLV